MARDWLGASVEKRCGADSFPPQSKRALSDLGRARGIARASKFRPRFELRWQSAAETALFGASVVGEREAAFGGKSGGALTASRRNPKRPTASPPKNATGGAGFGYNYLSQKRQGGF